MASSEQSRCLTNWFKNIFFAARGVFLILSEAD
jgi:hypothetical protein